MYDDIYIVALPLNKKKSCHSMLALEKMRLISNFFRVALFFVCWAPIDYANYYVGYIHPAQHNFLQ